MQHRLARLRQLEGALRYERATRQQRAAASAFELPDDPAERRSLYRELIAAGPRGPVPGLAGLTPPELAELYRAMCRVDPHRGARVALRRVAELSPEGPELAKRGGNQARKRRCPRPAYLRQAGVRPDLPARAEKTILL